MWIRSTSRLIPANVVATIEAATLFGNKYVSLTAPETPVRRQISTHDVIDVRSVTTEFNTLFETLTSLAEKVDPIELNATVVRAGPGAGWAGQQVRGVARQWQSKFWRN